MAKLIVIEGVDGLGKTTLVDNLQKFYQYEVIRQPDGEGALGFLRAEVKENKSYSIFERQLLHTTSHIFDLAKKFKGQGLIMDRCFWSGLVYGQAYGLTKEQLQLVGTINSNAHWSILRELKYEVYVLTLTGSKRFNQADNSVYEKVEKWNEVNSLYVDLSRDSNLMPVAEGQHTYLLNVDGKDPIEVMREAIAFCGAP